MIFTNTQRVWRYHTKGDYWVMDLKTKKLKQLGNGLKPASLMFAKFSPDCIYVAYVSDQNIYVEHLEKGTVRPLTSDGGGSIMNGTFDWVYEEELDCRDGFRWSPDSKNIAFWQLDTKGIGTFYMINNLDSIYPKLIPIPYPKVGTTNPAAKVGVVSVLGYRDGSPITYAKNPEGNLLLIHGSGDDNVHYQNCEVLVNELVKQQKIFSMMEYPMRSHGIYERDGTSTQLRKLWTAWWLDKLPAGGR